MGVHDFFQVLGKERGWANSVVLRELNYQKCDVLKISVFLLETLREHYPLTVLLTMAMANKILHTKNVRSIDKRNVFVSLRSAMPTCKLFIDHGNYLSTMHCKGITPLASIHGPSDRGCPRIIVNGVSDVFDKNPSSITKALHPYRRALQL